VSFAVPYKLANKVLNEIIATGKVTRGALGFVGIQQQAGSTNIGIIVTAVVKGSQAELGGLQVKDLVLSVNDIPASSIRDTLDYIADTEPGQTITFEVNRDGAILKLDMIVAELQ
jgi:serine protease DegS